MKTEFRFQAIQDARRTSRVTPPAGCTLAIAPTAFAIGLTRLVGWHRLALGALLLMSSFFAAAQINPLYEYRRSVGAGSTVQVTLTGLVVSMTNAGRVELDIPSKTLIDAGIKSGDPIEVDLGWRVVRAYAESRSEAARARSNNARNNRALPARLGVAVLMDTKNPSTYIVLDTTVTTASTSIGEMMMDLGVAKGHSVSLRITHARGAN